MKETRFIAQNKEKWEESENLLKNRYKDPEKLTDLFTQVMDDLSFSRTYYPNRSVRAYLNRIGREYFDIIYHHKKERKNRFVYFWMEELPQIVYTSRKPLLISLVVFLFAAAVGVFSSMKDPAFATAILGQGYVEMTKENIESGDPMAVYKSGSETESFLHITFNNLYLAFRTYIFGVFLSLGTILILLYNGVMVGTFQYFFVERGLFMESALTIWLHGTIEIASIIIAGGAGMILGSGLIFPGTYSRLQAFQRSAIRSLKLMLGIAPLFIIAGFIEGFITRYTDASDLLKLFLIVLSASLIVGYFVVYPWIKSRTGFEQPLEEVVLPPVGDEKIPYDLIRTNSDILRDAFVFYKRFSNKLLGWIAGISVLATIADMMMPAPRTAETYYAHEWWRETSYTILYAVTSPSPEFIILNTLASTLLVYRVMMFLDGDSKQAKPRKYHVKAFIQTIAITGGIYSMIYFTGVWAPVLTFFSLTFLLLWAFIQHTEDINVFSAFARTVSVSRSSILKVLGIQTIICLLLASFLFMLSFPAMYISTAIVEWNFVKGDEWANKALTFFKLFLRIFGFHLTIPLLVATSSLLYFSLKEISTAHFLKRSIEMIGMGGTKKKTP